ncbi:hypothetical protein F5Y19DRAFT_435068 [Xylariaceae sp. FL1651]|nr:hypothetical protein F5Y19DRAFT_435068 [Xylariaceae sp. FL1651]
MPPPTQRATYFIPANFDFPPPPDGPVKLGQLIAHPENPGRPVDPVGPVPFEGFEGMKRYTNSTKFSLQRYDTHESEVGLFGRALQAVSFKAGLTLSHAGVSYVLNDIQQLDVEFIEPTDDYVKASVERPKVQAALKKHYFRRRVYMVTGIKIAYPGAKLNQKEFSETRIIGEGELSGPAGAGNAGAGGNAKFSGSELRALELIPMKPFVYGYRLQECYYTFRTLHNREFVDGALCGVGSEDSETTEDSSVAGIKEEEAVIEFNGMDDEDLCDWEVEDDGGEFEVITVVDEGDGSTCDVIVPVTD